MTILRDLTAGIFAPLLQFHSAFCTFSCSQCEKNSDKNNSTARLFLNKSSDENHLCELKGLHRKLLLTLRVVEWFLWYYLTLLST